MLCILLGLTMHPSSSRYRQQHSSCHLSHHPPRHRHCHLLKRPMYRHCRRCFHPTCHHRRPCSHSTCRHRCPCFRPTFHHRHPCCSCLCLSSLTSYHSYR